MKNSQLSPAILLGLLLGIGIASARADTQVAVEKNPNSGLLTWTAKDDGFSIQLIQLLPDFVRAVYAKHGLPAKQYDKIAGYCDFGTIIRNTSGKTLDYNVGDWRTVNDKGVIGTIKTKDQWAREWRKAGVNFSWTLLPGAGTFYAGDWQQGFTTVKLPHGSSFDLIFKWKIDGVEHTGRINQLHCAPDVTRTE